MYFYFATPGNYTGPVRLSDGRYMGSNWDFLRADMTANGIGLNESWIPYTLFGTSDDLKWNTVVIPQYSFVIADLPAPVQKIYLEQLAAGVDQTPETADIPLLEELPPPGVEEPSPFIEEQMSPVEFEFEGEEPVIEGFIPFQYPFPVPYGDPNRGNGSPIPSGDGETTVGVIKKSVFPVLLIGLGAYLVFRK